MYSIILNLYVHNFHMITSFLIHYDFELHNVECTYANMHMQIVRICIVYDTILQYNCSIV